MAFAGEGEALPVPWGAGVRRLPWPGARLGAEQGRKGVRSRPRGHAAPEPEPCPLLSSRVPLVEIGVPSTAVP